MTGPSPTSYESGSARALDARHAIAFGFARHALTAVLVAAGLTRGDEVALSPLTCKVIPLALLSAGFRPVYVDISPSTLNIDPDRLSDRRESRIRAVMFQHTYGRDAGVHDAAMIARRRSWVLVEDCAQCVPIKGNSYAPGSAGAAAIFSNNLLKPLPAGSGGLATTSDDDLAGRIRTSRDAMPLRRWSAELKMRAEAAGARVLLRPSSYWTLLTIYKRISPSYQERPVASEIDGEITQLAFRPSRFQIAEGARWLGRLPEIAAHRRACCADYQSLLGGSTGAWEIPPAAGEQPLLYFPVLTSRKAAALDAARDRRLPIIPWPGSTPIYPVERLETLPMYGYEPGSCPVAESIAARLIGLSTEPDISAGHRREIAAVVRDTADA
jgi:dTDP-4-amino-4,6-dideoxygalactose transaminase